LFQVGRQFIILCPIIDARFSLRRLPTEIHPHKPEPGVGDQVQIARVSGDEVNVHADVGRNDGGRDLAAKSLVQEAQDQQWRRRFHGRIVKHWTLTFEAQKQHDKSLESAPLLTDVRFINCSLMHSTDGCN
jgi:hypothetical protein